MQFVTEVRDVNARLWNERLFQLRIPMWTYDQIALKLLVRKNVPLFNSQRKAVYDVLMKANDDGNYGFFP